MKRILIAFSTLALSTAAYAQPQSTSQIAFSSIETSLKADLKAAIAALEIQDYGTATRILRTAAANSNRLSLQDISNRLNSRTSSFTADDNRFALAGSSTLAFDNFIRDRKTLERRFRDDKGRVVTVRIFDEDDDLSNFQFIADDPKMIEKKGLELAEMAGEPALKKRGDNGELSVLMMSEDDHALIEVTGDTEDDVMAFIEDFEKVTNY